MPARGLFLACIFIRNPISCDIAISTQLFKSKIAFYNRIMIHICSKFQKIYRVGGLRPHQVIARGAPPPLAPSFTSLDSSKASSGNIPTTILWDAKEVICPYFTSCINVVINNCYFPDKLKEADVAAVHKNGDKCQKLNYRPISVLPNMSKIIERITSEQITY